MEVDTGLVVVVVERADLEQEGSTPSKEFHSLDAGAVDAEATFLSLNWVVWLVLGLV